MVYLMVDILNKEAMIRVHVEHMIQEELVWKVIGWFPWLTRHKCLEKKELLEINKSGEVGQCQAISEPTEK